MQNQSDARYDVAVIGYGPVGQTLAAMLGAAGHRVAVVERWPELFPLPRAGHIDSEIMRILQSVGIAETIANDSWKLTGYQLITGEGEVLHSFDWGHEAESGWYSDYSLFQPQLESLLHQAVSACPSVDLFRGYQSESLEQSADEVSIVIREAESANSGRWVGAEATQTIKARYVVGCDGANSIVRSATGLGVVDMGFEADWLVVFVEPSDPALVVDMPDVAQIMDPARPTTAFRASGRRFCRWEFMVMPGETAESMSTPEVAWSLIARWGLTPENSRLVRNTVFRFRSVVAEQWRSGRAFLAGDAAHLMPPFLGQGMCSGLRDAKNLAWRLDLVLRELAGEELLDSYGEERRPHVESLVHASLKLGEVISIIDPVAAAARDDNMRTGVLAPPQPSPNLVDGVLLRDAEGVPWRHAGELSVQGRVQYRGRTDRFDDAVGGGWIVLTDGWDASAALSAVGADVAGRLGARTVSLVDHELVGNETGQADDAFDVDGRYRQWFRQLGCEGGAVIIRPDFYLFGAVNGSAELDAGMRQLGRQLGLVLVSETS